mmetsp:Transcript_51308/g.123859  ORF Transcript_51308/g.123859 Transcript_51308/m.123859 type:complete len:139 (+) Transcript_51308:291-707(+)
MESVHVNIWWISVPKSDPNRSGYVVVVLFLPPPSISFMFSYNPSHPHQFIQSINRSITQSSNQSSNRSIDQSIDHLSCYVSLLHYSTSVSTTSISVCLSVRGRLAGGWGGRWGRRCDAAPFNSSVIHPSIHPSGCSFC